MKTTDEIQYTYEEVLGLLIRTSAEYFTTGTLNADFRSIEQSLQFERVDTRVDLLMLCYAGYALEAMWMADNRSSPEQKMFYWDNGIEHYNRAKDLAEKLGMGPVSLLDQIGSAIFQKASEFTVWSTMEERV